MPRSGQRVGVGAERGAQGGGVAEVPQAVDGGAGAGQDLAQRAEQDALDVPQIGQAPVGRSRDRAGVAVTARAAAGTAPAAAGTGLAAASPRAAWMIVGASVLAVIIELYRAIAWISASVRDLGLVMPRTAGWPVR